MAYISNNVKMLEAVLSNEKLMEAGRYTPEDIARIGDINQAIDSENYVISAVAQIIKRTNEGASQNELWKEINTYLFNHV